MFRLVCIDHGYRYNQTIFSDRHESICRREQKELLQEELVRTRLERKFKGKWSKV